MKRAIQAACLATVFALSWTSLEAQWPKRPNPDALLPAEGEPDVDAPAPRTADGTPDLSGVWRAGAPTSFAGGRPTGFSDPGPDVYQMTGALLFPSIGGIPRTSYGDALFKSRQATDSKDNPRSHCLPMGIVQQYTQALPARFVQTPRELVILYEGNGERRGILTNGRSLPDNDPQPWWNGYSVGRWEGDVLIVQTTHFRDGGWLDFGGNPLTDAARITERFRRPAYGRMEIDIAIDDKKAYLKPFNLRRNLRLAPDEELIEFVCLENNHYPPAPDRGKR